MNEPLLVFARPLIIASLFDHLLTFTIVISLRGYGVGPLNGDDAMLIN